MIINENYLILGIGTDIGKTYLAEKLAEKNHHLKIIKPIATGFDELDESCDTIRILKKLQANNYDFKKECDVNLRFNLKKIGNKDWQKISPFVNEIPTAPHLVISLNYQNVVDFCFDQIDNAKQNDLKLVIESAGGVMTPITFGKTYLDLAKDLKFKVLLVTSNYLGAISHTLTAIEVLNSNKVFIEKVIVNDQLSNNQNFFKNYDDISFDDFAKSIKSFYDLNILKISQF